jgi:serine/threonine protein kinase
MPASPEPKATDRFGPYELYERLGLGGMATVHRAKKHGIEGFERSVALKRMLSHLAEDASFVESFIREAKVASLLQHPNVAQVYDFGRIGGVYYIAMELVSGFDVRKLLRFANKANESIPLPVVLSILGELCDALEYAHGFVDERGVPLNIVHRDISPSNLIVAHTGHLKVIDFGIAKASSRQLHTESGLVKGKLGYMSPEAALGMQLSPVADIFSVGVVAWELVTASPLFSSRTDFETMRRIREADVVPPSRHNPSCPPDLDRVILNALERDPLRRLPSASAFRNALDDIAQRANVQASARAVAEWCAQYTQPSDSWAHSSSPSGRKLPLPPAIETPTSFAKPGRTSSRLRRSTADIQLAAEIWGDEIATSAANAPLPDFSHEVRTATPSPTAVPPPPSTQQPTVALPPSALPQSMPLAVIPGPPPREPKQRRAPIIALMLLALVAGSLSAYLVFGRTSSPPVAPAPAPIAAKSDPKPEPPRVATAAIPEIKEPVALPAKKDPPAKPARKTRRDEPKRIEPEPPPVETPVTVAKPEPPPKVEPPKVEPPLPPKVGPKPVVPEKPARATGVASSAVQKLSGEVPTLRGDGSSGDALVKMCIDERGNVSSVKVVKSTADVAGELSAALATWKYKPYLNADQKPSPVCFPLSLRLVFKR